MGWWWGFTQFYLVGLNFYDDDDDDFLVITGGYHDFYT
jgi:hypothetical protein